MALVTWPSTLPQVPDRDYVAKPVAGLNDPEEQFNPQRVMTWPVYEMSLTFLMTLAQVTALRTFYTTTTNNGGKRFTVPWATAMGYDGYHGRILSPPSWVPLGADLFRVGMTIELSPGSSLVVTEVV